MADDFTIATRDGDRDLRAVEAAAGIFQPVNKVAPHMPTVVAGAQYALAVSSTAVTLTVPAGATHCLLTVHGDAVNMTEDGSTPTASNGLRLPVGFIGELALPAALKFIRVTGDATLNVTYRKYA
jgi:hypothetical protein